MNSEIYTTAVIEAGHFYANQSLTQEQLSGIDVGKTMIKKLNELGFQTIPCILIDNYNAVDTKSESNLVEIQGYDYNPKLVLWEKDAVPYSISLLESLKQNDKTKEKKGNMYLKEGFSILQNKDGKYSCALLDAGLYVMKFDLYSGICVTVLPESYKSQQETTKRILKGTGQEIPIINIYYKEDGENQTDQQFFADFAY